MPFFRSSRWTRWLQVPRMAFSALCDCWHHSTAGSNPRKETSHGTPDFYRTTQIDGLSIFYREAGPKDAPTLLRSARTSLIIADVRASVRAAFRSVSPCRARLSGLRSQRLAGPEKYSRIPSITYAEIMNHFTEALGLSRYTLYMQDYGGPWVFAWLGPSGLDRGFHHPGRCGATTKVWGRIGKRGGPFGRSRC